MFSRGQNQKQRTAGLYPPQALRSQHLGRQTDEDTPQSKMKSLSLLEPISVYELYAGELPDGTPRYFSPFCWAARLAIVHKSIPVKTLPWQFQESDKIAFSNQGLVSLEPG